MPETREVRSVVDAAEQAAAASDYASAEQLLREAAFLQEASLGPLHPDLAHTLNKSRVVCEITEKPVDASTIFEGHARSRRRSGNPIIPLWPRSKNLEDFCEARDCVDSLTPLPTVSSSEASLPVASRAGLAPFRSAP